MPQPVVSSRYLFLWSPPKTVLTFSPDSRATLRKLTPRSEGGTCSGPGTWRVVTEARDQLGRAMDKTPSRDNTNPEQLRDFRNKRREGNKRSLPGPFGSCKIC